MSRFRPVNKLTKQHGVGSAGFYGSVGPPQDSLSISQLQEVERCVSDIISANQVVHSQEVPLQRARSICGLRTVDEVSLLSVLRSPLDPQVQ